MNTLILRKQLERHRGKYQSIRDSLAHNIKEKEILEDKYNCQKKALFIIQEVSKFTQQEVEFHVSDLVSHGLAAVFDSPYKYKLEYVLRRDKTEADQYWQLGNNYFQPNGGGVRDVSAFALHVACIVLSIMQKKKVCPILILDEPTKHLKPTPLQERAGNMLQEISKSLGIQIIIVTHDSALSDSADRTFKIQLDKRRISNATKLQ